jgi:hypothetical protein
MKRFNLTSFPILVILLLCLCFLRISRTSCISEGHGEKPQFVTGLKAAVWFYPDENDTNLEDGWHP